MELFLNPEQGQQFEAPPIYTLAEVNKKEKFAVFEIMNNDFWRGGGIRLNIRGDDLEAYNQNQSVLFGHNPDAPLGQATWTKHYPNKAAAASIRSKWSPPNIKTDGLSERKRAMTDFAHEVFDWVDSGQMKGASAGIIPMSVLYGEEAVKAYKEDYPDDRSREAKSLQVYVRAFQMFEWSITPIPRIASALKQSASDFAKKQLDFLTTSPYIYMDLESRLTAIEKSLAETSGQARRITGGDGEKPLAGDRSESRDVSVDTVALQELINLTFKGK